MTDQEFEHYLDNLTTEHNWSDLGVLLARCGCQGCISAYVEVVKEWMKEYKLVSIDPELLLLRETMQATNGARHDNLLSIVVNKKGEWCSFGEDGTLDLKNLRREIESGSYGAWEDIKPALREKLRVD